MEFFFISLTFQIIFLIFLMESVFINFSLHYPRFSVVFHNFPRDYWKIVTVITFTIKVKYVYFPISPEVGFSFTNLPINYNCLLFLWNVSLIFFGDKFSKEFYDYCVSLYLFVCLFIYFLFDFCFLCFLPKMAQLFQQLFFR